MVEEIVSGLKERGIPAESQYSKEHDIYLILVPGAEFLAEAQEFYRVKLGIIKPIEIDQEWIKIKTIPRGKTTFNLILVCCFIFGMSFTATGTHLYHALFIGGVESGFLYEVSRGQIWRLITPVFLHMSFMHIVFNMMWFKDLGYIIENVFGKNFLIKFILMSGLVSNLLQYCVSGPQFGGMSGVLYGMLGFIWVHKKINESFAFSLPRFDVGMMIGWYFVCLTGWLGPIANTAHGGGLVAGILMAVFLDFKWDKLHLKFLATALFFLIFTLAVEGYKLDGRYYFLLSMK
jgi:GlpG protein